MAGVVRWFKSGEIKLTKFSALNDDTEGARDEETAGSEAGSNVRVYDKGKPQHIIIV